MRQTSFRRRGGVPVTRATRYRGAEATPVAEYRMVPVTDGLTECPSCGGGVRTPVAVFSNREIGVICRKTRVFSNHVPGGARRTRGDAELCKSSGLPC